MYVCMYVCKFISNEPVIMRGKGLFNISEDFVSCTSLEFTPMAMASYLKKQTEKNRQKHDRAT